MMKTVKFTCEGTRPLLMERMSEETLEGLRKGVRPPINKNADVRDVAGEKLYKNPDTGNFAIPTDNFWACLVAAGTLVSYKGKKNISNAEESLLPGVMDIKEEFLDLSNGDEWKVDRRRGVLKSGKGGGVAVCIVRPMFPKWGFSGTIEIDDDQVNVDKIKELVEVAGRFKGLGGFRKKGRFGRFEVTKWEVVGEKAKG